MSSAREATYHRGTQRVDWQYANCVGQDPDLFMEYETHADARKVCERCPLAADCYFEAVRDDLHGTWGGVWFGKPGRSGVNPGKSRNIQMMKMYRAELCVRMGLTLQQFTARYGVALDGVRRALRSL